ncbi:MAG: YbgA family protein, partial [Longimicrobiales bacterium]
TDEMNTYARGRREQLVLHGLDGYGLKRASPSCGMERVKVYRGSDLLHTKGVGLFAQRLVEAAPTLPMEEEGRLNDPALRENFIERVFCRNRWRTLIERGLTRGRLVDFHTAHKLLLWAHNEAGMMRLGRLLGDAGKTPDQELFDAYEVELQSVMKSRATKKRHVNVLHHALGYLKRVLDSKDKKEILLAVDDFGKGLLPLIVPVTLFRFNIRRHGIEYLLGQLYFDPHPRELLLRNHV